MTDIDFLIEFKVTVMIVAPFICFLASVIYAFYGSDAKATVDMKLWQ